jgi:AraC-like DNA-binding protein
MHHKHLPHDHGNISNELLASIPDERSLEGISELFKLMSDTGRAKTFFLLCHCEECVINISAMLDVSPSATSQRLKALKDAGLATSRRDGKEVYYTAAKTPRAHALHEMLEGMLEVACPTESAVHTHDAPDSHLSTVKEIHALITSDLTARYTIDELASRFHINKTSLKAAFKTVFGKPIAAYMKEYRIKRAMELLTHSSAPVSEVAAAVGYDSASKFTEAFKDATGMTPMNYRRK